MRWTTILTIAVVIVIAAMLFLIVIPYTPLGQPAWQFKGWWQFGVQVETAVVNQPVTLKLEITGGAISVGVLNIEIKKDIPNAYDEIVHTESKPIALFFGQTMTIETTFTPDKPTDTGVREYYFKIYMNGVPIYDPTTPGQRYGLKVTGAPPVSYSGGEFEG